MGITIHYSGKIKVANSLPLLIEELKDVAEIHSWPYAIFDREFIRADFGKKKFNHCIYGIAFTPPECETVNLTFDSNGQLRSAWAIDYYFKNKENLPGPVFVKTQYAGPSIHKLIIHLLEYISKKYLKDFKVEDEGGYWKNRDEKELDKVFKQMNGYLKQLGQVIKTVEISTNESFEDYFKKLLDKLKKTNFNTETD